MLWDFPGAPGAKTPCSQRGGGGGGWRGWGWSVGGVAELDLGQGARFPHAATKRFACTTKSLLAQLRSGAVK